jgi:hypothetical protein
VPSFTREVFDRLSLPGSRFEWLTNWLTGCVWSPERFEQLEPGAYLEHGERLVNEVEETIAAAAPRIYDELMVPPPNRDLARFLGGPDASAIVVFDGLSLREVPVLLRLAAEARLRAVENSVSVAALPSETVDYVEARLGCGRSGPSHLPGRRDLRDRGVAAYYYGHPGERHTLDSSARCCLLWSAFPDNTYSDSGARFADHFAHIQSLLQEAWNGTVMALPRGRRILVTSDHGYVFLGSGLSFSRHRDDLRQLSAYLGGDRYARISERGEPPAHPDLLVFRSRDLAVLKGRVQPHPPGPSAGKLYKHGGLSLMEMLVPWLVLEREP